MRNVPPGMQTMSLRAKSCSCAEAAKSSITKLRSGAKPVKAEGSWRRKIPASPEALKEDPAVSRESSAENERLLMVGSSQPPATMLWCRRPAEEIKTDGHPHL